MNVVRMQVKDGKLDEWRAEASKNLEAMGQIDGLLDVRYIQTGDSSVCVVGRWASQQALADARPKMIEGLDRMRHLLAGDTDPVSGPVLMQRSS